MRAQFREFARYNAWANARAFEAAAALDDSAYRSDLGAAFGSVHGTLNHLLVTDRIWLARLSGAADPGLRLDQILFERFADLRAARAALDAELIAYVDGLSEADLAAEICYTRASRPEPARQSRSSALAHLFNHQTHHRGQAHALLTRLSGAAPAFDLLFFQRAANPAKG